MLQAIKTFFHPAGVIQLPSALYIVHLKTLPGGVQEPVVWSLPGTSGGRGLVAGLRVWVMSGRGWRPRWVVAALRGEALWSSQLPLAHPLPATGVDEEVHLLIQQHLNVTEALHFDYRLNGQTLTFYAMPAREVEALRATYRSVGVRLAGLEWDVFALRRAFVAASGDMAHQPLTALLWVGTCSALFGIYSQTGVMFHARWQHSDAAFEVWLVTLLEATRAAGLRAWQVCCAVPSQVATISQVGQSFGVAVSFIELSAISANPILLAEAFLAWGLALRGLSC